MKHEFWNERWLQGQIGFHLPRPHSQLVQWGRQTLGPPGGRVLVPLCGKTQDLTWLEQQGYSVVGVEFVEKAAHDYFSERQLTPVRRELQGAVQYQAGAVSIYVCDFFAATAHMVGTFDAVYDRAALVAIDPQRRRAYVEHLAGLAKAQARFLLVTFEHDLPGGPPFSVDRQMVQELSKGLGELKVLADEDVLGVETRFRDRGATRLHELTWAGQFHPAEG